MGYDVSRISTVATTMAIYASNSGGTMGFPLLFYRGMYEQR